ncbi:hypothetical protein Y032_0309g2079 [Ancylostoma ceylanicum]|uniref:Zasp-like motif domain-containing protein n=1 Tax=Ancylostoma ceylanicum TaxID=53326 RepID=A0A016S2U5_9BILA|nr:hypothetical protein Y032_0309g2079 [Ancylostoma ceylanicum]
MRKACVGGVWVPAPIESHFREEDLVPFSYTKPNVRFLLRKAKLKLPKAISFNLGFRKPQSPAILECGRFDRWKTNLRSSLVLPLVRKENMAQPVHLQYNSPMPIYSRCWGQCLDKGSLSPPVIEERCDIPSETAEEQYQQQIGGGSTPIPMPSGDKHFDPSKSATLKFIKEGNEGNFGEHFFEQIASAEAPKHFEHQEPDWARYAREKSERARSRTPADPSQHHTPSMTPTHYYERNRPASFHERVRETTPKEFIEKSRIYTHTNQPRWGPAYSQTLPFTRRRGHSETRDYAPGYEYGGLDYTKGLHFPSAPYDYVYERHSRVDDQRHRTKPGYELGGTDFGHGYIASGPYHGHGPDPPRLRPHYSADPRSACNSYYAPNVDEVDANLLVGDTISNQKIRHEVRHINQNEFGTSFAPPGGFKRDHITVRRSQPPPEPVTFSLSANKARYGGSTGNISSQSRERDIWRQRQANDEKEVTVHTLLNDDVLRKRDRETTPTWHDHSMSKHEAWMHRTDPRLNRNQIYPSLSRNFQSINERVYTNEPNWSRTVQQRRNAWEQKAYDTEARVNLPASAKVPPPQPPAWHNKAARTHNVWQHAADSMSGMAQPQQSSYETSYYQTGGDSQQYKSQYHEEHHTQSQQSQQQQYQQRHEEHHTTTTSSAPVQSYSTSQHTESHSTHTVPVQQTYISSGPTDGSNAELLLNTGFNANQVEYVRDHFDKYRAGPKYPGSHYEQMSQSNYSKTYSSSTQQQNVTQQEAVPLPASGGQTYSFSTETRVSGQCPPTAPQHHTNGIKSYIVNHPKTTTQGGGPVSSNIQERSYNQTSYSTETSKPIPIERSHEESSYHKSVSESTRSVPAPAPETETTIEVASR